MNRKEAIEAVKNNLPHSSFTTLRKALETLIPELAESEDERIRKSLIDLLKNDEKHYLKEIDWLEKQNETFTKKDVDDAYLKGVCDAKQELEKQDESIEIKRGKNYLCTKTHKYAGEEWREGIKYFSPEDYALINQGCAYYCPAWSKEEHNDCFKEVEYAKDNPKFKVGDFIKHNKANLICKVISVNGGSYYVENIETRGRIELFDAEQNFRLWTVTNAKDGDVLCANGRYFKEYIFNFSSLTEDNVISTHFGYDVFRGTFDTKVSRFGREEEFVSVTPATKEQRDTLFAKMKEAGYEWDAEKKELKKIAQEPAWSEEDEKILNTIINDIQERHPEAMWKINAGNTVAVSTQYIIDWLKSLKEKVGCEVNCTNTKKKNEKQND